MRLPSLYSKQEICRITSVQVGYNYVELSFRFLFFHAVVTVYIVSFLPSFLSRPFCFLLLLHALFWRVNSIIKTML